MTWSAAARTTMVRGRLDDEGRLIEADPELADLHRRSGGTAGGAARLAPGRRLARLVEQAGHQDFARRGRSRRR